jgi:hypothetical protein
VSARYVPQLTCDGCGRHLPGAANELIEHLRHRAARFGWTSYKPTPNCTIDKKRDRCRNCTIVAAELNAEASA